MEYLLDNYSGDKMLNLLTLFKQGNTYDEALTEAYGFDIDGLDARWRESLVASTVVAVSQSPEPFAVCHSERSEAISPRLNRWPVSVSYISRSSVA